MTTTVRFTASPAERAAAQMRQIASEVDPSERADFLSALRDNGTATGAPGTVPTEPTWRAEREAMSSRLDAHFAANPDADMTTALVALERGVA